MHRIYGGKSRIAGALLLAGVGLSQLESFGQSGFDYPAEAMRQRYNRTGNPADAWSAFILQGVANGHHRYEQGEMEREELIKRLQELERQKGNQGNYSPSTPPSRRLNPNESSGPYISKDSIMWNQNRAHLPSYTNVLDKRDKPTLTSFFPHHEEVRFNPNVKDVIAYTLYRPKGGTCYKVEHGEEYFRFLAEKDPKFLGSLRRWYQEHGFRITASRPQEAERVRETIALIEKAEAEQATKPKNPLKVVGNFFRGCLFGGR